MGYQEFSSAKIASSKQEVKAFQNSYYSTVNVFMGILDFLSDNNQIRNTNINNLANFSRNAISDNLVPAAITKGNRISIGDSQKPVNSLHFTVFESSYSPTLTDALILVPSDFLLKFYQNPLMQISGVIYHASQVRDFITGRLPDTFYQDRAYAFEAELLLSLIKTAEQNNQQLPLNDYLKGIVKTHSPGLAKLRREVNYDTPSYSLGFRNSLNIKPIDDSRRIKGLYYFDRIIEDHLAKEVPSQQMKAGKSIKNEGKKSANDEPKELIIDKLKKQHRIRYECRVPRNIQLMFENMIVSDVSNNSLQLTNEQGRVYIKYVVNDKERDIEKKEFVFIFKLDASDQILQGLICKHNQVEDELNKLSIRI